MRIKHKNSRWQRIFYKTCLKRHITKSAWDLKPGLLNSGTPLNPSIYASKEDRLVYIHASHLKIVKGVNIFEFGEWGRHGMVKLLRNEEMLPTIIQELTLDRDNQFVRRCQQS